MVSRKRFTMKQREEILADHFEKEYGFRPDEKQINGFKYVFGAMEEYAGREYAGRDIEGYIPEPFADDDPNNPRLLNHHHIAFYKGWITWRGPKKPTTSALKAIAKVFKFAERMELIRVKRAVK